MLSPPTLDDDSKYTLGVISGKLDLIMVQNAEQARRQDARFSELDKITEDHEDRISSLEQGRSWLLGGAAAIGTAAAALGTWLGLK